MKDGNSEVILVLFRVTLTNLIHFSSRICSLPAHVGPSYWTGQTHFTSPLVNSHLPPFLQGFLFSPFFGKQALSTKMLKTSKQN